MRILFGQIFLNSSQTKYGRNEKIISSAVPVYSTPNGFLSKKNNPEEEVMYVVQHSSKISFSDQPPLPTNQI